MTAIVLSPPSKGYRTQRFGENPNPDYQPGGHTGDDWAYTDGVNIFPDAYAMDAGTVVWADWARNLGWPNKFYLNPDFNKNDAVDESSGITVCLMHWYGYTTYSHLAETHLNMGDTVKRGQRIGTVGNTGRSFGKHLHAELILFPVNFNTPTYGRSDPAKYMTASLTPQGAATTPAPKELFTVTQIQDLTEKLQAIHTDVRNTHAGVWTGGTAPNGKKFAYGALPIVAHNQTLIAQQSAQIKALVGAIAALAKGEKFDEAKLLAGVQAAAEAGSRAGAATALQDGVVDVNINVAGKPAGAA